MDRTITATMPISHVMNGKNYDPKELTGVLDVYAIENGKVVNPVTVKQWMGRHRSASVVYCCVWTHNDDLTANGHGRAGGYGYHRGSAALADAIDNAGIKLDKDISGVGDSAMRDACEAIAAALGYDSATFYTVNRA